MIGLLTGVAIGSTMASFGEGAMLAASVYLAVKGIKGKSRKKK